MIIDRWHLITGEYPPQTGGVGDYTAQLGTELARAGVDVHVWTSGGSGAERQSEVTVHRSAGRWSPADLHRLDAELDQFAPPRRLLVQYAPNVWNYKGMNLGFCRWLVRRRALGDDVRVMFHEVWYTLQPWDKPTRWLLVQVQHRMARTLMDACTTAYISIPAWEALLRRSERAGRKPVVWLPVPSNIAVADDAPSIAALRRRYAPRGGAVLGSFGTFGGAIASMLAEVFPRLLDSHEDRIGLLIGRGSDRFAAELIAAHPRLADRLVATGNLPPAEISLHLQACDLLVQPYPDGVSSRRTSLMAGLSHGVATVSNLGERSEAIWTQTPSIALAPSSDSQALALAAESLLVDSSTRAELAASGRAAYQEHFAIARTVEILAGTAVWSG